MKKIVLIAVPNEGFNGTFKNLAESLNGVLDNAGCIILYPPDALGRANHFGVFFALFPSTEISRGPILSLMATNEKSAAREAIETLEKPCPDVVAIFGTMRTANALRKLLCEKFNAKSPQPIRNGKARIIRLRGFDQRARIRKTTRNKTTA